MALGEYRKKRSFSHTPEPAGNSAAQRGRHYVVQKHDASRLHYDFRLEQNGVLWSWAVPKGPCLDPAEKRLAVQVEDHPIEYRKFEGIIPAGQYGGGTVMIWDQGSWQPVDDNPERSYQAGKIKFIVHGKKLHGLWMLLRMRSREKDLGKTNWLLIKERDQYAQPLSRFDVLQELPDSAVSGQNLEEIAAGKTRRRQKNKPSRSRRESKQTSHQHPVAVHTNGAIKRAASSLASLASKKNGHIHRGKTLHSTPRKTSRAINSDSSLAKIPGVRRAPMPKHLQAQLAMLVKQPPAGDDWLHEQKFDGYRMFCRVADGDAHFLSRTNQDWTSKLRSLAAPAMQLGTAQAVLDGEVVVLDAHGLSSFQALQNAFGEQQTSKLVYFVFDLLYLNGYDLTGAPLERRKAVLESLLGKESPSSHIRFSEHLLGRSDKLFQKMCGLGLEGMISKCRDAPYSPGRTGAWLKTKCRQEQEFVIGGFTRPAGARIGFGALLLGYYRNDHALAYAGRVGTGFSARSLRDILGRLRSLEQTKSPFADFPNRSSATAIRWVRPKLVAQIQFSNWTDDGLLRQAAFLGLRDDKPAREVKRELPAQPKRLRH